MDIGVFKNRLLKEGKQAGFTDMEIFVQDSNRLQINAFNGEIDSYNLAEERGLAFRGIFDGKMGYSFTEKIDESSIDMLIKMAKGNSKVIEAEDQEEIFPGSYEYPQYLGYSEGLNSIDNKDKVKFVLEMESLPKKIDKRVIAVPHSVFITGEESKLMFNNKGLNISSKNNLAASYVSVLATDGKSNKSGLAFIATKDYSKMSPEELVKEAVEDAVSKLGSRSIKSDRYPVVLKNTQMASLLSVYWSIFSAENVQKGLSKLKDKLEQSIAAANITITDDPLMEEGLSSATFDGEGVATFKKEIISKGELKTLLHNIKTAKKDNVKSTANGFKGSYKGTLSLAPFNFYMEPGSLSQDDLFKKMDRGLYITELQGLHAGTNSVSGDFSLFASGFYVENGSVGFPVEQITVSGNFYELLKEIVELADDFKFSLPSGGGSFASPSVLISSLSVAGD